MMMIMMKPSHPVGSNHHSNKRFSLPVVTKETPQQKRRCGFVRFMFVAVGTLMVASFWIYTYHPILLQNDPHKEQETASRRDADESFVPRNESDILDISNVGAASKNATGITTPATTPSTPAAEANIDVNTPTNPVTAQQPLAPAPPSPMLSLPTGNCSCWNPEASRLCCTRNLRHFHKMGYVLTFRAFAPYRKQIGLFQDGRSQANPRKNRSRDYRDVVVTRNFYDALMSGYLYHKTGRECWLDPNGNYPAQRYYRYQTINKDWGAALDTLSPQNIDPPIDGRSLCAYLNQTSVESGLKVYIDLIWSTQYKKIVMNYHYAYQKQQAANNNDNDQEQGEDGNRTLFLCYEKFVESRDAMVQLSLQHFYPSEKYGGGKVQPQRQRQLLTSQQGADVIAKQPQPERSSRRLRLEAASSALPDAGGHATSHDPELRQRLRQLIEQFDTQIFGGRIADAQSKLNCPE